VVAIALLLNTLLVTGIVVAAFCLNGRCGRGIDAYGASSETAVTTYPSATAVPTPLPELAASTTSPPATAVPTPAADATASPVAPTVSPSTPAPSSSLSEQPSNGLTHGSATTHVGAYRQVFEVPPANTTSFDAAALERIFESYTEFIIDDNATACNETALPKDTSTCVFTECVIDKQRTSINAETNQTENAVDYFCIYEGLMAADYPARFETY